MGVDLGGIPGGHGAVAGDVGTGPGVVIGPVAPLDPGVHLGGVPGGDLAVPVDVPQQPELQVLLHRVRPHREGVVPGDVAGLLHRQGVGAGATWGME